MNLDALVKVWVFFGWLFTTILSLMGMRILFGGCGVALVGIVSIFAGLRIIRYFRIQDLAEKIRYFHGLKKLHVVRPCLVNEDETNKELVLLEEKLAKKYHRKLILN